MLANVAGRVENTKLASTQGLLPVFEAVINSIHAIQELGPDHRGKVEVVIDRKPQLLAEEVHGNYLEDIEGFTVTDNGIGFDQGHYTSFEVLDSRSKADIGGKGIGRLYWLLAFYEARISSIYKTNEGLMERKFAFRNTPSGIEDHTQQSIDGSTPRSTTVKLIGFRDRYRKGSPKSAQTIAMRIVEHCLSMFAHGGLPTIVVKDANHGESFNLQDIFEQEFKVSASERQFNVGDQLFKIYDVMVKKTNPDVIHRLFFCAHDRVVNGIELQKRIPVLADKIERTEGDELVYCGYVSSKLLNDKVCPDRLGFDINEKGKLEFNDSEIYWNDIEQAALDQTSKYLEPQLASMREQAYEKAVQYVKVMPKYRPLLTHRRDRLQNLSLQLNDTQLDIEMHKLMNDWRLEIRSEVHNELEMQTDEYDYDTHKLSFDKALSDLQEIAKADLSEYVIHRATVLSFLKKLLGKQEDGKFPKEEALHRVIFPIRSTSDDVDYESHNLWLLDERLSYHQYLASDLRFGAQKGSPVEVDSADRPDLIIYDSIFAYTPEDNPTGGVTIVEFKRPERKGVDGGQSPVDQVLRYVEAVRSGKVKRADGSMVESLPSETPFYCYVIATLTDELRGDAERRGFTRHPDNLGYFSYIPHRAYVEILSYRKLLQDAQKRNAIFLDKLQIRL